MWGGLRRRVTLAVLAAAFVAGGLGAGTELASGDELTEARAEANAIAARVAELDIQVGILAEDFNAAQAQLADVQARIASAEAGVAAAHAEVDTRLADVREYAIAAYVRGANGDAVAVLLNSSDGSDVVRRRSYLSAATGDQHAIVDDLRATEEDLQAQIAALDAAQVEAQTLTDSLGARRAEVAAVQQEQQRLLDSANGEVSRLVAEEQSRVAAQAAQRAAARQAQSDAARRAAPPSGPPPPVGAGAEAAIAEARRHLGEPYEWGAAGPNSFDCSGFTQYAWRAGGVSLPHNSRAQYDASTRIPMSAIEPGDLIFYGNPLHHVALYMGNGQIIHAPSSGEYVRIDSVYYWDELVGAGRVR